MELLVLFFLLFTVFSFSLHDFGFHFMTIVSFLFLAASACYGDKWKGVLIAAAGDQLWNNGAICGKNFIVKCTGPTKPVPRPCTGKSMTVTIVDHYPEYDETLALSRETFDVIANRDAGIIKIDYYLTS